MAQPTTQPYASGFKATHEGVGERSMSASDANPGSSASSGGTGGDPKGDTTPIKVTPEGSSAGTRSGTARVATLEEAKSAVDEISKGGTNLDTLVLEQ